MVSLTLSHLTDLAPEMAELLRDKLAALPAGLSAPERWRRIYTEVLTPGVPLSVWRALYEVTYADWDAAALGPPPAWLPDHPEATNLGRLIDELGMADYAAFHRWSIDDRDGFWALVVERLGIRLAEPYTAIRGSEDPAHPDWLAGARLNLAASCFQAPAEATAIVTNGPGDALQRFSYGELDRLSNRVANGLVALGIAPGEAVAIDMPMTVNAVAIYLGIVKAGAVVVSISDSFSAAEIGRRLRLGEAQLTFTQDYASPGAREGLAARVIAAGAERCVVLPCQGDVPAIDLRPGDLAWEAFLAEDDRFAAVPRRPDDACNILFSSGTTGDPKVIPWTQTTPIRAAADGWLHHDIQPGNVIAWPTNLGWMMGPWLVFASLINGATIALFDGLPTGKGFGRFVQEAGVTMLGVVPSLVKSWRLTRCMESFDWRRLKCFSSTGECSNADDMFYLMALAGMRPVIEYCGGTEIGGGYITGTLVQPAAPATFTTPAIGTDFHLLDDLGLPTDNGELFLVPPTIGLSTRLLNHDHAAVYLTGTPAGPKGERLRRHGDQIQRLPGGFYRSHGRVDDTMNLKGIKVSSAELERIFNGVAEIKESAAIAVEPPGGGPNLLIACVVLKPGVAIDARLLKPKLQAALREQHGSQFKLHDVVVLAALPRTASNKVMRRELRASYQANR